MDPRLERIAEVLAQRIHDYDGSFAWNHDVAREILDIMAEGQEPVVEDVIGHWMRQYGVSYEIAFHPTDLERESGASDRAKERLRTMPSECAAILRAQPVMEGERAYQRVGATELGTVTISGDRAVVDDIVARLHPTDTEGA